LTTHNKPCTSQQIQQEGDENKVGRKFGDTTDLDGNFSDYGLFSTQKCVFGGRKGVKVNNTYCISSKLTAYLLAMKVDCKYIRI